MSTLEKPKLPLTLVDAFERKLVKDRDGIEHPLHSNIAQDEAERLYSVVQALNPAVSVEVGFAQGVSALSILQALADAGKGVHHVIDPFQESFGNIGLAMAERAGLDARLEFHRRFAEDVIPQLPRLQFGFVDASHLFDLSLLEFILIDKKLDVGGLIGFHDMWMPSLQKLLRYVLSNRSCELYFHPGEKNALRRTDKDRIRAAFCRILTCLPRAKSVFAAEFLAPWQLLDVPNLVFVKKLADDSRDWRFHQRF